MPTITTVEMLIKIGTAATVIQAAAVPNWLASLARSSAMPEANSINGVTARMVMRRRPPRMLRIGPRPVQAPMLRARML
jgi:hypothetical protein